MESVGYYPSGERDGDGGRYGVQELERGWSNPSPIRPVAIHTGSLAPGERFLGFVTV